MFRASSYEPGNRAGAVIGTKVFVSTLKKFKYWNINLYRLRLLYGFADCFNFNTTSAVENITDKNYAISAAMLMLLQFSLSNKNTVDFS